MKYFDKSGIKTFNIGFSNKKIHIFYNIFVFFRIYFLMKKINPNYLLNYTILPNIFGSLISYLLSIKTINTFTGLGHAFTSHLLIKNFAILLIKISQKKVYKIIFHNKDDSDFFINKNICIRKNSIITFGSGVDLNFFKFSDFSNNKRTVFLFVGRILKNKGINEFIESSLLLKKKFPSIKIEVLGKYDPNNPSSISKKLYNQWKHNQDLHFHGFKEKSEVRDIIQESNCVILPTYREGMPKSLMEASALGKPIITTNTTGANQIVNEGKNGFLCKPKNVNSLLNSMIKFMNLSDDEKIIFGKNSLNKALKEYDNKKIINIYINILEN